MQKGQGLESWSGTAGGQGLKVYTVGIHLILICIFVCGHSSVGAFSGFLTAFCGVVVCRYHVVNLFSYSYFSGF